MKRNYSKHVSIKSKPVQFQEKRPKKFQRTGHTVFGDDCRQILLILGLFIINLTRLVMKIVIFQNINKKKKMFLISCKN